LEAPIDQIDNPMSELEKEVSEEKIVLNDVVLKPRHSADLKDIIVNAGTNNGCIMMLKALSKVLCDKSALSEKTLYERLLVRLAKTSASADAYFHLNSMMGSTDLIVQQLSPEHMVKGTSVNMDNNTTNNNDVLQVGRMTRLKNNVVQYYFFFGNFLFQLRHRIIDLIDRSFQRGVI